MIIFVKNISFDEIHKKQTVIFYGLPVVCNILLWYPDANIRRGPSPRYKASDLRGRPRRGVFPCLHTLRKAVSKLVPGKDRHPASGGGTSAGAEDRCTERSGGAGASG